MVIENVFLHLVRIDCFVLSFDFGINFINWGNCHFHFELWNLGVAVVKCSTVFHYEILDGLGFYYESRVFFIKRDKLQLSVLLLFLFPERAINPLF